MTDDQLPDDVPGQHDLGPTVERFDDAVDHALERVRGNAALDRLFTTGSHVGDFSAMIAVVLFALVPAVKYTAHGLRSVPSELIEAGVVCGCTKGQILRKIQLPMAVPMILLGLNQTILLSLSMLVITALVGTRDLGQEVYAALATADVGRGLVAGFAVAAIAIIADRLIGAAAGRARARMEGV